MHWIILNTIVINQTIIILYSVHTRGVERSCFSLRTLHGLDGSLSSSVDYILFPSLPDCSQNQIAVSDTLHFLSDFQHSRGLRVKQKPRNGVFDRSPLRGEVVR